LAALAKCKTVICYAFIHYKIRIVVKDSPKKILVKASLPENKGAA